MLRASLLHGGPDPVVFPVQEVKAQAVAAVGAFAAVGIATLACIALIPFTFPLVLASAAVLGKRGTDRQCS